MIRRSKILAALVAGFPLASGAAASAKDAYIYGPPPDWSRYKVLGEAAVRAELPDQANWQVEWPNGYVQLGWRHKGQVYGYMTCGQLRAIGPVTGHYPLTDFVVVIDHDAVQRVDISPHDSRSLVSVICGALVQQGKIPPASLMMRTARPAELPTPPGETTVTKFGMTVRPMPEGAYVISVKAESPAAKAGLVPGTVITRVNGITLSGMGPAMAKLLGADAPTLTLDTAAGAHLALHPDTLSAAGHPGGA